MATRNPVNSPVEVGSLSQVEFEIISRTTSLMVQKSGYPVEVGSEHPIFFKVLAPSKRWWVYSPAFWLPSGCCNCQGCGGAAGQGREPMRCWVFRGDFFFLQNHWIWDILTRAFLDRYGRIVFCWGSCELGCFFSRLEIHRLFCPCKRQESFSSFLKPPSQVCFDQWHLGIPVKQLNLAAMLDLNIHENEPAWIDPSFISLSNASRCKNQSRIIRYSRHGGALGNSGIFLGNPLLWHQHKSLSNKQ